MNQSAYDTRQVTSQGAQKVSKQAGIAIYEAIKALFDFMGHMVKVFLSK